MIINHLRKFVEDNLRVVIPDVGAFLRKSKADVPFEASVIFSPFLRSNDGVLEGLVAEEEHIDRESAAEKVRKFVQ
ncbi:MAG: hypothetical protein LBH84_09670, partial [Prevotellaceae bacterium]|nr:hypothetical protein [Prevotellaceae bacterium]